MRCVIISGSPEYNAEFLKSEIKDDDFVICADKGYSYAKALKLKPDIIIGDFDSYDDNISSEYEIIRLDVHKDDTDTMHCIDVAFERGFREIVILCGIGGRFDHTFANVSALQYIIEKGGYGMLLSEKEHIEFLSVGKHEFKNFMGKTFSVFPFGCSKVLASYSGAEYPLDKSYLYSSYPMGISNIFVSDNSELEIYDGNAIIIINLKTV